MANPQPGWYPDPMGGATKLRYWDGSQWTDNYSEVAVPQATQAAQAAAVPQSVPTQSAMVEPVQAAAQQQQYAQPQSSQPAQPVQPIQPSYPQGYQQPQIQQNFYSQPAAPVDGVIYQLTDTDRTLRLIAFILAIISTVALCWLIFPLAWCIPMTVHTWGLYKGKKANTVAFGVCTLLFLNIIGGILLLVSNKER